MNYGYALKKDRKYFTYDLIRLKNIYL